MYSSLHPENPVRLVTQNIYADLERAVGELFIYADEATFDALNYKFKTEYLNKFIAEIQHISRSAQRRNADNTYSE